MQPENSRSIVSGGEQLPVPPTVVSPEAVPTLPSIEAPLQQGGERYEQAAEAGARAAAAAVQSTPVAINTTPLTPIETASPPPVVSSTTPLVAADEDLIEKEWVDKAKEIIEQTRDDPHARTQKVNELQRDYLQKRYGKVVGASE